MTLKEKLTNLIREVGAMQETYKAEIAAVPASAVAKAYKGLNCEEELDNAFASLTDALYEINEAEILAEFGEAEDDGEDDYSRHTKFEGRHGNFV